MSYREEKYRLWLRCPGICNRDFGGFARKGLLVVTGNAETWSRRYLEKANHNLDFAFLVTELHEAVIKERFPGQTFYDWVTIACYYAIYHAALALVSRAGFKSRSHLATLCGVMKHYYHAERRLEKKHVEILGRLDKSNIEQFIESQGLRERASYGVSVNFGERLAAVAREDAIEFVNKAKEILAR
jgi:uncharacterized protein (UPF0332 family)